MKRGLTGRETFTFECGQHKRPLVPVDGPPFFNGHFVPGRTAPDGSWVIDLSDVECPGSYASNGGYGLNECVNTWRVWIEQDGQ